MEIERTEEQKHEDRKMFLTLGVAYALAILAIGGVAYALHLERAARMDPAAQTACLDAGGTVVPSNGFWGTQMFCRDGAGIVTPISPL